MDLVRDYQAAFNRAQQQPEKSMDELLPVIKQHGEDPEDPTTWRWDVMRAVVGEDMDYVKLVTATELRFDYEHQKAVLQEHPEVLNVTAMLLNTHYDNYKDLFDLVALQKEVFGPELFSLLEDKTIKFLDRLIGSMLIDENSHGKERLDYANHYYKVYENEYKNYYYWPHIKDTMDRVLADLNQNQ